MSKLGWWLEIHCIPLWRIWARYYCPRPIDGAKTARACYEAGWCGCDNRYRFEQ